DRPIVIDSPDIRFIRFTSKVESTSFSTDDPVGQMEKKLQSIPKYVEGKGKKSPVIKLQINNKLEYSNVVELLDLCRRVGKDLNIKDIGLMAYPKDRGPAPPVMP